MKSSALPVYSVAVPALACCLVCALPALAMPLETDRFRSGDDSTAAEPPPNPAFTSQQPAQCVLADVYAGLDGVERGDVKFIRILERVPCPPMACKTDEDDEHD